ncbi:MAG: aspartyl protease family protein [Planctomycetes bacterium]|nr:aspartyl protease family protein [Planctomycetota bacterium]
MRVARRNATHVLGRCLATAALLATSDTALLGQLTIPGGRASVAIPVRRTIVDRCSLDSKSGLMFVGVRVGDAELEFIFDTGAGVCVFDKNVVRDLGLEKTGQIRAMGSGGAVPAPTYTIAELGIRCHEAPDLVAKDFRAIDLDLSTIASVVGHRVDGIVGSQLFRENPFTLDLEQNRIVVYDAARFEVPREAAEHRLMFALGLPCLRLELPGLRPRWFMLDTGNMGTLILHAPLVDKHVKRDLLETLPVVRGLGVGKSASKAYLASIERLDLGSMSIDDVPVMLSGKRQEGLFANRTISGNVGSGVLSRGRWTFDFKSTRCWVEPTSVDARQARIDPSLGIHFRKRDDRWIIGKIITGGPADKAGIEPWSEILEIDGEPAPRELDALVARLAECTRSGRACRIRCKPTREEPADDDAATVELRAERWLQRVEFQRKANDD